MKRTNYKTEEYRAKRRADYQLRHPITTEKGRKISLAARRRRTGDATVYKYADETARDERRSRKPGRRNDRQQAYENSQRQIDIMMGTIRNCKCNKPIGAANLEYLQNRVAQYDAICEELLTLNPLKDWGRISELNYKKQCIRRDFEPYIIRPDKLRDNV